MSTAATVPMQQSHANLKLNMDEIKHIVKAIQKIQEDGIEKNRDDYNYFMATLKQQQILYRSRGVVEEEEKQKVQTQNHVHKPSNLFLRDHTQYYRLIKKSPTSTNVAATHDAHDIKKQLEARVCHHFSKNAYHQTKTREEQMNYMSQLEKVWKNTRKEEATSKQVMMPSMRRKDDEENESLKMVLNMNSNNMETQHHVDKNKVPLSKDTQKAIYHTKREKLQGVINMKMMEQVHQQEKLRELLMAKTEPLQAKEQHIMFKPPASGLASLAFLKKNLEEKSKKQTLQESVLSHRQQMLEHIEDRDLIRRELNSDLMNYFDQKKQHDTEVAKLATKQRLMALKSSDTQAYFKLLEETKNDRITDLIQQTDTILKSLGAKLVESRSSTMPAIQPVEEKKKDAMKDDDDHSIYHKFLSNQNSYYELAHRVKEIIKVQPTTLAFGQLKPYQLTGLQWLVSLYNNKLNGILADEMGLGKTIQTIALITYLMEYKNNNGFHLVIVPLGTIHNWRNEFEKWAPHVQLVTYMGDMTKRKKLNKDFIRPRRFQVLLTQYEFISRDRRILRRIPWNYIIMDEGHRIKNANCKLVTDLRMYTSQHRLLLTGTPLQNDLKELWSLLNFLFPTVFESVETFEQWFASPFDKSSKMDMNEEEMLLIVTRLHQVLRPLLLRRIKSEVLHQLPEKIEHILYCDISEMQRRLYKQIHDKSRIGGGGDGHNLKSTSLNNTVMQLRKVVNHPYLFFSDYETNEDLIRASGKLALLDNILTKLKATGHRVLLFSQMTQMLDILERFCEMRKHNFIRLDGSVNNEERGPLLDAFNDPSSPHFIFLLSTRAGGLGLNLQTADTVIIFDSDWNPQQDLQAMARAHRIGQTRTVSVLIFCTCTPVEERILARAKEKRNTEMKVIGAGKFNDKYTQKERQTLLQSVIAHETTFKIEKVPNGEQLNNMIARSEDEIAIFSKIDAQKQHHFKKVYDEEGAEFPDSDLMQEDELPAWMQQEIALEMHKKEHPHHESLEPTVRKRKKTFTVLSDSDFNKVLAGEETYESLMEEDRSPSPDVEAAPMVITEPIDRRKRVAVVLPRYQIHTFSEYMIVGALRRGLHKLFCKVANMQVNQTIIGLPFWELPNKKVVPSYFQVVKQPICLRIIEERIVFGINYTIGSLEQDILLLQQNCMQYNDHQSQLVHDVNLLLDKFYELKPIYEPSIQASIEEEEAKAALEEENDKMEDDQPEDDEEDDEDDDGSSSSP